MEETSKLTFKSQKRGGTKVSSNVPCYLFYHVTDQTPHNVTVSSLSNIQVNEKIQLYFHCC